jgi:hypothetical protein
MLAGLHDQHVHAFRRLRDVSGASRHYRVGARLQTVNGKLAGGIAIDAVYRLYNIVVAELTGYQPDVHAGQRLTRLVDYHARRAALLGVQAPGKQRYREEQAHFLAL